MDTQPQLADVISGAIASELDTRWTAELGRILSYDPATRWASVQILASNRYVGENGDVVAERIAPLVAVPVVHRVPQIARNALARGASVNLDPKHDERHSP